MNTRESLVGKSQSHLDGEKQNFDGHTKIKFHDDQQAKENEKNRIHWNEVETIAQ